MVVKKPTKKQLTKVQEQINAEASRSGSFRRVCRALDTGFNVGDVFKYSINSSTIYDKKMWWVKSGRGFLSLVVAHKDLDNVPWFYEITKSGKIDTDELYPLYKYIERPGYNLEIDPVFADHIIMSVPDVYDPGSDLKEEHELLKPIRTQNRVARAFNKRIEEKFSCEGSFGEIIKRLSAGQDIWMRYRWQNIKKYTVVKTYNTCPNRAAYMIVQEAKPHRYTTNEKVRAQDFKEVRTLTLIEPLKILPVRLTGPSNRHF